MSSALNPVPMAGPLVDQPAGDIERAARVVFVEQLGARVAALMRRIVESEADHRAGRFAAGAARMRRCRASRLLTRAFNADNRGRMIRYCFRNIRWMPAFIARFRDRRAAVASRRKDIRASFERWSSPLTPAAISGRSVRPGSSALSGSLRSALARFRKLAKLAFGLGVEIAGGEGRIGIPLARQIPGDVAQIFPLQRQRLIFRMSLKEDEMAAQLLGEDIDAGVRRCRQHLIAPGGKIVLAQRVDARMRDLER